MGEAVVTRAGEIVVKGFRREYTFKTLDLIKQGLRLKFGKRTCPPRYGWPGSQNPMEKISAGAFYDETRDLWAVPRNYNKRSQKKFPTVVPQP